MTEPKLRTLVIVNERAGGGAMADIFRRVEHRLADVLHTDFDVSFTAAPGDAIRLAREALQSGMTQLIVAGGDGTVNESVNGFFDLQGQPINPQARLALLAGGTGGDLRKSLGIASMDEALTAIERGKVRTIDLGKLEYCDLESGSPYTRYFVNITSFGLGGLVDRYVARYSKTLPGRLAYVAASVRALMTWKNPRVHMRLDDGWEAEHAIAMVAAANGRYFGSGMRVAPDAELDDGLFDVVVMRDFTRLGVAGLTRTIYKGSHVNHDKVEIRRGRVLEARSEQTVLLDVDGEPLGKLPARFELLPKALQVVVP